MSAGDCGVCGTLGVFCQVKDDLRCGEEPWRSVGGHGGGEGLKLKRVRKCAVEVELRVALKLRLDGWNRV